MEKWREKVISEFVVQIGLRKLREKSKYVYYKKNTTNSKQDQISCFFFFNFDFISKLLKNFKQTLQTAKHVFFFPHFKTWRKKNIIREISVIPNELINISRMAL